MRLSPGGGMCPVTAKAIFRSHPERAIQLVRLSIQSLRKCDDKRSLAIVLLTAADIFKELGDLDEALDILSNTILPIFEEACDFRHKAVTLGRIADIHFSRGDLDKALRIRYKEQLPICERFADMRAKAITMGRIADILVRKGYAEEALRIRYEEEIPVFRRLGDKHQEAVSFCRIAEHLLVQCRESEALKILLECCLPVALSMENEEGIAHIRHACARARIQKGDWRQEGLGVIYEELVESYNLNTKISHAEGIANVGYDLGTMLIVGRLFENAIPVLEAAATAAEKLGWDDLVREVRDLIATARRLQAERDGPGG